MLDLQRDGLSRLTVEQCDQVDRADTGDPREGAVAFGGHGNQPVAHGHAPALGERATGDEAREDHAAVLFRPLRADAAQGKLELGLQQSARLRREVQRVGVVYGDQGHDEILVHRILAAFHLRLQRVDVCTREGGGRAEDGFACEPREPDCVARVGIARPWLLRPVEEVGGRVPGRTLRARERVGGERRAFLQSLAVFPSDTSREGEIARLEEVVEFVLRLRELGDVVCKKHHVPAVAHLQQIRERPAGDDVIRRVARRVGGLQHAADLLGQFRMCGVRFRARAKACRGYGAEQRGGVHRVHCGAPCTLTISIIALASSAEGMRTIRR